MKQARNNYEEWRHNNYEEMESIIRGYGPFRVFVTLTFRIPIRDAEGWRVLDSVVRRLHRTMFGKAWRKMPKFDGVASLERTHFSTRRGKLLRSCHFHLLIKDHPRQARDIDAAVRQMAKALQKITRGLRSTNGVVLVNAKNGVTVLAVDDQAVSGYVVKEARNQQWKLDERIRTIASICEARN